MINQDIPEFKTWVDFQLTNPPKTIRTLENRHGRCCLGNACHILNVPKLPPIIVGTSVFSDDSQTFGYTSTTLPLALAQLFNIRKSGLFTDVGLQEVTEWMANNIDENFRGRTEKFPTLIAINDDSKANHKQIGELILHLAKIEKEKNVECFSPCTLA